ncbi:MAG TPA: ABC transporter permease [Jiangellaceae bacterium]
MSTRTYAVRDSMTMLRRQLKRVQRYPTVALLAVAVPVILLLLFVYVFGETMGSGIGGAAAGRAGYATYITPAILVLAVAGAVQGTAISVAMDMAEGIVARFRTMAIARVSVLTGHVLGSLIQIMLALVLVVGVAMLVGFDPNATAVDWLATAGLFALLSLALIWFSVALGLVSKTVEGASNLPMPLFLLPFLGSGFVPTDSMPAGLGWFAENQPFTPIMETTRGLLTGTEIGNSGWISVAWCVAIALVGYLWAKKLYNRDPSAVNRSYSKVVSAA